MNDNIIPILHGLQPLVEDPRDFPLGGVYSDTPIEDVPNTDFVVAAPLRMKDQGETDFCSAYAVTSVSEDQEAVELLPEYQFYATKRISGDFESWGADLRDACKSAIKYGSLPTMFCRTMQGVSRATVLDEKSWPKNVDEMAAPYKKETFFKVTGRYDTFDNIRAALWGHRADYSTIVTGALWKTEWISAKNGIITTETANGNGFGHAFKFFGQKVIDGELYLIAQLSNGTAIGDGGLFYFNRKEVNDNIGPYGIFMFKDLPKETAEKYLKKPYTIDSNWLERLVAIISNFFKTL